MPQITRICDMRDGFKMQVFKSEEDGDIHVSVLPEGHNDSFDGVEFCNSGSQSPHTYKALCNLMIAMEKDAKAHPQEIIK